MTTLRSVSPRQHDNAALITIGTIMPRQDLAGYFFAFLAALGLAMYLLFPTGSELRLLGIVLLIFSLPFLLRFLLRYVLRRAKEPAPAPYAAEQRPTFGAREANLTVEGTFSKIVATSLMRKDSVSDILDLPCLLALGSDGFSTRLWRADKITGPWPNEEKLVLNAEFLVPERALPRFPIDTIAKVLVGNTLIGSVKVLRNHAEENLASRVPV